MTELINNKVRIIYKIGTAGLGNGTGYKTYYIKGLALDDIDYDFELNYEIKPRKEYYLLCASFKIQKDSKTFGTFHQYGNHHWIGIIGIYETQNETYQAMKDFDQSILPQSETRKPLVYKKWPTNIEEYLSIKPVKLIAF